MHTLLILFSLALALGACLLCLTLLRLARSSGSRRALQVVGMLVPVFVLALLVALMVHFLSQVCFLAAPPIDAALARGLFDVGAVGIAAAVVLNLARAVLLPVHLHRHTWEAPTWLQAKVDTLLDGADVRRVRKSPSVRVAADGRPWALVTGLFRPRLVVSSGLVAMLDGEELDAVLCHELLHLRRGDLWWATAGAVLRDLTWFLPVTRRLYSQLVTEQEIACDDQVSGERRRLALASALARVWQAELGHSDATLRSPRGALAFLSPEPEHQRSALTNLELRVRRLLDMQSTSVGRASPRALVALAGIVGLFVPAQLALALLAMNSMGCSLNGFLMTVAR